MFFKSEKSPHILSPVEIIQTFAETHYPGLSLEPKMIEQLLWLQNNSINTSQSSVQAKQESINLEVKRILSRLYCFKLLQTGGASSYRLFIQAQSEDNRLSEHSFNQLSNLIRDLSIASRKCLMATCFITKSDRAIAQVPADQRNELPADSEQFITHMVSAHSNIFPICHILNEEERGLLPYAFYKNAHARQMLDMEGGYNMTASIAEAIRTSTMTYEQFNLWFARWILNIAGLDGHINPQGSIYLTQPVADCIVALKLELDQLWINPEHRVIDQYLLFRARQLDVSNSYIAYFGALMRQYTPKMGHDIQVWFSNLSAQDQHEHQVLFTQQLTETKVTPSFKPTVLVNLLALGCSVSDALTIFTQIELDAMQTYHDAVTNGLISDTTPLSFRNIAFKESLSPIMDYYIAHNSLPKLNIDAGGYLTVTPEALEDECHASSRVLRK